MDNTTTTTTATATTSTTKAVTAPVNINTADATALAAVKGISKKQAAAIVDYRTKNGDFKSVDDLKNIKGFGPKTMKRIASKVTV
ncbi:MAG TPA: transporter [Coxiellaceae bacterium]|nr:transporter [Coxiellaceae bacterium]